MTQFFIRAKGGGSAFVDEFEIAEALGALPDNNGLFIVVDAYLKMFGPAISPEAEAVKILIDAWVKEYVKRGRK